MYPFHPTNKSNSFLSFMSTHIKVDHISQAWVQGLTQIYCHGIDYLDERGDETKVFFNLMMTIKKPLENLKELKKLNKAHLSPYNLNYLDSYADQLINGPKESDFPFEYSYHERLRKRRSRLSKQKFVSFEDTKLVDSEYIDQISEIIDLLKKSPSSRRAVCTTWIPSVDLRKEEVPCMNWLVWSSINDILHLTVGFRSHDFWGAYENNAYGLTRLLEFVANSTNLKVGSLTTISVNSHYNKMFEKEILKVISNEFPKTSSR